MTMVLLAKKIIVAALLGRAEAFVTRPSGKSCCYVGRVAAANADSDINSKNSQYIRWQESPEKWELQTAVTTFAKGNHVVELHAQVHYGQESYFDYYNSQEFNRRHDGVLYELLVDQDLVRNGRVTSPIGASPHDQRMAQQYGLANQVNVINYHLRRHWRHADLTRQEFLSKQQQTSNSNAKDTSNRPLWQVAATGNRVGAAAEAASAFLVGPPMSSDPSRRRLFTNLFLPGRTLTGWLRMLLWWTVPSPEVSILLLDWSSLSSPLSTASSSSTNSVTVVSPLAMIVLQTLFSGRIYETRQLLFGQVLVNGSNNNEHDQSWSVLVTQRNDHALQVLENTLEGIGSMSSSSHALLYGSSHCPDIHEKLVDRMGFKPIQTSWRTAWSISTAKYPTATSATASASTNWILPPLVMLFYLIIGGMDWIATFQEEGIALGNMEYGNATLAFGLYLARHVLLYLGLSKFVVEWNAAPRNDN